MILGRVAELSEMAQRVLRLAAVVGSSVDHDLLAAVARTGGRRMTATGSAGRARALEQAIEELVDRQVLVVEPSRTGYRFRHALTPRGGGGRHRCPASAGACIAERR